MKKFQEMSPGHRKECEKNVIEKNVIKTMKKAPEMSPPPPPLETRELPKQRNFRKCPPNPEEINRKCLKEMSPTLKRNVGLPQGTSCTGANGGIRCTHVPRLMVWSYSGPLHLVHRAHSFLRTSSQRSLRMPMDVTRECFRGLDGHDYKLALPEHTKASSAPY